jgi:hydroxymethylbilane synthase
MKSRLKMGTRGSQLARAQSHWVAEQIRQATGCVVDMCVISTRGDRIIDKPLAEIGGKGLFTVELEAALRSGDIDFAVHSLKDLPTEDPEGLCIGAIPVRADARDVWVGRSPDEAALVGTGSARRQAQLALFRPDIKRRGIRGNVDTRLKKLDDGEYDAIILAAAGLARLSIERDDILPLSIYDFVPAPGQGALGVQCRSDDEDLLGQLACIDDEEVRSCVWVERGFLDGIGGGCSVPAGCHVRKENGGLHALAFYEGHNVERWAGDQKTLLGLLFSDFGITR